MKVLAEFEQSIREDEARNRMFRGATMDGRAAEVSIARNYDLLGRLSAVSWDPGDARRARQECVAILDRAQKAGDGSQGTVELLGRCRAGLKTP